MPEAARAPKSGLDVSFRNPVRVRGGCVFPNEGGCSKTDKSTQGARLAQLGPKSVEAWEESPLTSGLSSSSSLRSLESDGFLDLTRFPLPLVLSGETLWRWTPRGTVEAPSSESELSATLRFGILS